MLTVVVAVRAEAVVSWQKKARSPHFAVDAQHSHDLHQAVESLQAWHAPDGRGKNEAAAGWLPQSELMRHAGVPPSAFVAETVQEGVVENV